MASLSELLNRYAPDFSLPVLGGGRFNPAEYRGHILVLTFWSVECAWSRRADVVLVYRQLTWEKKGVKIVGIASNLNETETGIKHEMDIRQVKYPMLLDQRQQVADLYRATATPQFYIADKQGIIRYMGALDDASFSKPDAKVIFIDRAVNALLAGRPPEPAVTAPYGCNLVRQLSDAGQTTTSVPQSA